MSHTPGPWIIKESFGPDDDLVSIDADAKRDPAPRVNRMDAHLIAAAPDLLAALKRVRAEIPEAELNYASLVPDIDAAIVKAEGR